MINSRKHWYLVGSRSQARLFEQTGIHHELKLVHTFENPQGKLKDSELVSDRQGRSDRAGFAGHMAVGGDYHASTNVFETFAREVATYLEQAAQTNAFETLVLVAEPRALGIFTEALGAASKKKLRAPLIKDLVHVSNRDMAEHLRESLTVHEVIEAR